MLLKEIWVKSDIISKITGCLVLSLAMFAFILSYSGLYGLAYDNGIGYYLSFLWPLLLDFFVIISKLSVLRNSVKNLSVIYPWALVICFSLLAVLFNIIHVMDSNFNLFDIGTYTLKQAIFALAPLVVLLAFHLFIEQIKSEIPIMNLAYKNELEIPKDKLDITNKDTLEVPIENKLDIPSNNDQNNLEITKGNPRLRKKNNLDKIISIYKEDPKFDMMQLPNLLGVSDQTVINYLKELESNKVIRKNGAGIKVLNDH